MLGAVGMEASDGEADKASKVTVVASVRIADNFMGRVPQLLVELRSMALTYDEGFGR